MIGHIHLPTTATMPHIPQQIDAPKSWDDFENLCCALFQHEWANQSAQRYGRSGQAQQGIDILGQNFNDDGHWYGVQCKLKDGNRGGKLTTTEIDEQVAKVDVFATRVGGIKLAGFVIATTAPVDVALQNHCAKLTIKRHTTGLCSVALYGWEHIEGMIRRNEAIHRQFFSHHFELIHPQRTYQPQELQLSAYFADPENHLATLRQQLLGKGSAALVAKTTVQGMGGVGKTQLALKYFADYADQYHGAWWFRAENEAGLQGDCALFCEKQGIGVAQNETPAGAVKNWLQNQHESWLLVYDNAEDAEMVQFLLPQRGKHHIVLTSRNPHWDGLQTLPLGTWTEAQGAKFLRARLGSMASTDADLRALSKALAGLPLALEQACAYICKTKLPIAKYLEALAQQTPHLLQRKDSTQCANSVLATLGLAFAKLNPAAQELLTLCSWYAAEPIPMYLFTEQPAKLPEALRTAVQDELQWIDTVTELTQYALCQRSTVVLKDDAGNGTEQVECLTFHRLTQAAARLGSSGKASLLLLTVPGATGEPSHWPRCKAVLAHVLHWHESGRVEPDTELHFCWLLSQMAAYLQYGPALYRAALALSQRALAIAEKAQGPEHPDTGTFLNNLAGLYKTMGQYDQALPLYLRALAIAEKAQGPEHPEPGTRLNNLAGLYHAMGQYDQALPLYLRALAIAEKAQGPEHPETGTRLNNLAVLYKAMGQYDQALPLYLRALAITEKAKGPEHPETGTHLNNLATLYNAIGQYDQALPLFQRALAIAEKAQGPEHPKTGTRLNNLAMLYKAMGQYDHALPLYLRALAILEKILGSTHPNTIQLNANLAKLRDAMRQQQP
jgi:tetratricopeptide (TPR) repeat protein